MRWVTVCGSWYVIIACTQANLASYLLQWDGQRTAARLSAAGKVIVSRTGNASRNNGIFTDGGQWPQKREVSTLTMLRLGIMWSQRYILVVETQDSTGESNLKQTHNDWHRQPNLPEKQHQEARKTGRGNFGVVLNRHGVQLLRFRSLTLGHLYENIQTNRYSFTSTLEHTALAQLLILLFYTEKYVGSSTYDTVK